MGYAASTRRWKNAVSSGPGKTPSPPNSPNASLRNQLVEAGIRPVVGEAAEYPDLSAARSSDDGGCAPRELLTKTNETP